MILFSSSAMGRCEVRIAVIIVDFLISLLPGRFRRTFGREIPDDFIDHCHSCVVWRQGVRRTAELVSLLATACGNLVYTNIAERCRESTGTRQADRESYTRSAGNRLGRNDDFKRRILRSIMGCIEAAVLAVRKAPDSLLHDIRHAIRGLWKRPGFTSAVIVLLAVGIGANVAMFSAFHQALIRPLPYAEPESLVLGRTTFNGHINPDMSAFDYFDYRERNEVFESVGAIRTSSINATITCGGGTRWSQRGLD